MPANIPLPAWTELYTAAILEIDKDKLYSRVHAAKMAICDRAEELAGRGTLAERVALDRALRALNQFQEGDSNTAARPPADATSLKTRLTPTHIWNNAT